MKYELTIKVVVDVPEEGGLLKDLAAKAIRDEGAAAITLVEWTKVRA